jgi:hypothetical protein
MVVRKSDSRKRREGTRSMSNRARNGCNSTANARQAAAVTSVVPRHPQALAIVGPESR